MVSVLFHYRADVLLGLFDPLHLGEIRYGRASTHSLLVFDLPDKHFGVFMQRRIEEGVEEERKSITDTLQDRIKRIRQHSNTKKKKKNKSQQTWNME